MDRDANSTDNLQERKNILIADLVTSFRDIITHATAPVDNTASTGQTAYNSLAINTKMSGIIKSTEDLLTLTRKIRELWVIGALKAPSTQDAQADQEMNRDAAQVFSILNALRERERQSMLQQAEASGGGFTYENGEVDGPGTQSQPPPQPAGGITGPQGQQSAAGTPGQQR